ncbi:hypothetical protein PR001_g6724 [Phytophthora rubi]|uniref:Uncharacterized protein n=1 Tax=Phytophthora rubi TaxID=129364 RepID=A0A6A3NC77_9STRA|nr:hypothetical protein PR002_g7078 [Phytophthora rubi]KAE9041212.1 hypothetical protein PR001_g6724 [Phytophthora rubi]
MVSSCSHRLSTWRVRTVSLLFWAGWSVLADCIFSKETASSCLAISSENALKAASNT